MTNEELDKAVAKAQGWKYCESPITHNAWWKTDTDTEYAVVVYKPTRNWKQAGELLEKYKIDLSFEGEKWLAEISNNYFAYEDTPQKAICLAVLELEGEE